MSAISGSSESLASFNPEELTKHTKSVLQFTQEELKALKAVKYFFNELKVKARDIALNPEAFQKIVEERKVFELALKSFGNPACVKNIVRVWDEVYEQAKIRLQGTTGSSTSEQEQAKIDQALKNLTTVVSSITDIVKEGQKNQSPVAEEPKISTFSAHNVTPIRKPAKGKRSPAKTATRVAERIETASILTPQKPVHKEKTPTSILNWAGNISRLIPPVPTVATAVKALSATAVATPFAYPVALNLLAAYESLACGENAAPNILAAGIWALPGVLAGFAAGRGYLANTILKRKPEATDAPPEPRAKRAKRSR